MFADFPKAAVAPPPPLAKSLLATGTALRPARAADLPVLRHLFESFRTAELLLVPWSPAEKRAFLDEQFALQHAHFTRHFPRADFWVIERVRPPAASEPIGRLYLDRGRHEWRIVDIGFVPEARGAGLGTALIAGIQECAAGAGAKRVALQVAVNNPAARALYRRMGFAEEPGATDMHLPMAWRVS